MRPPRNLRTPPSRAPCASGARRSGCPPPMSPVCAAMQLSSVSSTSQSRFSARIRSRCLPHSTTTLSATASWRSSHRLVCCCVVLPGPVGRAVIAYTSQASGRAVRQLGEPFGVEHRTPLPAAARVPGRARPVLRRHHAVDVHAHPYRLDHRHRRGAFEPCRPRPFEPTSALSLRPVAHRLLPALRRPRRRCSSASSTRLVRCSAVASVTRRTLPPAPSTIR